MVTGVPVFTAGLKPDIYMYSTTSIISLVSLHQNKPDFLIFGQDKKKTKKLV